MSAIGRVGTMAVVCFDVLEYTLIDFVSDIDMEADVNANKLAGMVAVSELTTLSSSLDELLLL